MLLRFRTDSKVQCKQTAVMLISIDLHHCDKMMLHKSAYR